ncbi:pyrroloquinoline quinone biosynthesis protein PqqB [Algiphilus sp.]|uniref:pyrroloquinoline quinone biosynthesis protein PqqB n=1 Tax=Algiphilus sp. TaxID=1872431 RepID=UPI003B51C4DE
MQLRVLGSAAGGGYPQWNCNCPRCQQARGGRLSDQCRTQSSIAVSADGQHWLLVNASPDIRQQILDTPALHPSTGLRGSGVAAVLLADSQLDHVTGLLMLRESHHPLSIYCTPRTEEDLRTGFPVLNILSHYCGTQVHPLPLDGTPVEPAETPGVRVTAIPLKSKAPPYSSHRAAPEPGDNLGFFFHSAEGDGGVFYAPGLGDMDDSLLPWMARANVLLVDGTTWTDDEMQRVVGGRKTAREMGHLPQSGAHGTMALLAQYPKARRILIHINNTNPILDPASEERAALEQAGIETAHDGMHIQF